MSQKAISTFFVLLLLTMHLFAGNPQVKYLGIDQGLSNNVVTNIYQDHKGFMWFGTYDGLNRYDGYGFKIFRNVIGDSTSLNNNTIYTIEGDADHNIWVGGLKGACVLIPLLPNFPVYNTRYIIIQAGNMCRITSILLKGLPPAICCWAPSKMDYCFLKTRVPPASRSPSRTKSIMM